MGQKINMANRTIASDLIEVPQSITQKCVCTNSSLRAASFKSFSNTLMKLQCGKYGQMDGLD